MASTFNGGSSSPILIGFKSPGLVPDVRIVVFKQEFHVHSVILKLHSAFFRKFLDSPEKSTPSLPDPFPFDYVSVVDDDGVWGLEPVSMAVATTSEKALDPELHQDMLVNCRSQEQTSFHQLLCAMYNRPYAIQCYHQFLALVLTDFYCALPILSASLHAVFSRSPGFSFEIEVNTPELLRQAKKLRNAVLFRECLVHLASYKTGSEFFNIGNPNDPDLTHLIAAAHDRLCQRALTANYEILKLSARDSDARDVVSHAENICGNCIRRSTEPSDLASYYRVNSKGLADSDVDFNGEPVVDILDDLLLSRLCVGPA